eukprot:gene7938-16262_t
MNILSNYGNVDEEISNNEGLSTHMILHKPLCSAPSVALVAKPQTSLIRNNDTQLMTNPKADVVLAPMHGPAHPFKFNAPIAGAKLSGMGHIEETLVEDFTFNDQYQTYQRSGYAVDISTNEILGDSNEYFRNNGDTARNARVKRDKTVNKRGRDIPIEDLGDAEAGPWAAEPENVSSMSLLPVATELEDESTVENGKDSSVGNQKTTTEETDETVTKKSKVHISEPDEEAEMWERVAERKMGFTMPPRPQRGSETAE